MKSTKTILRSIVCAVLVFCAVFAAAPESRAINTVFMVPPLDQNYVHHNTLYLSPNYNISAQSWGYGTTVDILNTTGDIDSLLSEVFANVTPKGGERIMGIYMEGAGLSDASAKAIANAGWYRVEMYYETFMVSCPPVGETRPDIQVVSDAKIDSVLKGAGFDGQFSVIEVSGVNSTWAYLMKYDTGFAFLRGKTVRVYKYLPDVGRFVQVEEVYFDSYDRNFLEWDHPETVEPDMNGLYVAVGQELPSELVCTAAEAAEIRANPPAIPNTQGNVQWTMAPGLVPENFTAETVITPVETADKAPANEVSVDFAYSGELPEGTEVTLSLPADTVSYLEGTLLYLYYCNPRSYLPEPEKTEEPAPIDPAPIDPAPIDPTPVEPDVSEPPTMPDAPIDPNNSPTPSMPSVPADPADQEPLYSLPLKGPNTTRIIVVSLLSVIAAGTVIKLVLTIIKKKK